MPYIPNNRRAIHYHNPKFAYGTSMRVAIKQVDAPTALIPSPRMWKVWLYNGYATHAVSPENAPHYLATYDEFSPLIATDNEFAELVALVRPVVIKRDTCYRSQKLPELIRDMYVFVPYYTDRKLMLGYGDWVRVDLSFPLP